MFWAFNRDLTATQKENINLGNVATLIWQHLLITVAVTTIVLAVGMPLGVLVTRPGAKVLRPSSSVSPISVRRLRRSVC